MRELPRPPAAEIDGDAVEVFRVWVANRGLHVVLNHDFYRDRNYEEEWAWGLLLADMVRHLSNAIADDRGDDARDVLRGIREAFESELAAPTSEMEGGFLSDSENGKS